MSTDTSPISSEAVNKPPNTPAPVLAVQEHTIYVEFCISCGLNQQFSALKAALHQVAPEIRIIGNYSPPRMKAFEVVADDGTLLYSKITSGRLPHMVKLANQIKQHFIDRSLKSSLSLTTRRILFALGITAAVTLVGWMGVRFIRPNKQPQPQR